MVQKYGIYYPNIYKLSNVVLPKFHKAKAKTFNSWWNLMQDENFVGVKLSCFLYSFLYLLGDT